MIDNSLAAVTSPGHEMFTATTPSSSSARATPLDAAPGFETPPGWVVRSVPGPDDWIPELGPLPVDPLSAEDQSAWRQADDERFNALVNDLEAWKDAPPDRLWSDTGPPTDPGPPASGPPGVLAGCAGAELDQSEVASWRYILAESRLPGQEVALIDLLRELEDLKSTAAAIQARVAVAFDGIRRQAEADKGIARSKRGTCISAEIALARRESPYRGGRLLGLAKALVHELPHTLAALTNGMINEWRATLIARETACLTVEDRLTADAWLADHLVTHPTLGDRRLVADTRRKVIELDQTAVVRRRAKAAGGRRVTTRPLPDGMAQVSIILPLVAAIAVYASLVRAANQATSTGEGGKPRGRGAVMADTLVDRVTGRPAHAPADVTVNVVITDQALLSETEEPAHVDGFGPVPAAWVRDLIAQTPDPKQRVAIRRLFRAPGRMIKMETASRRISPAPAPSDRAPRPDLPHALVRRPDPPDRSRPGPCPGWTQRLAQCPRAVRGLQLHQDRAWLARRRSTRPQQRPHRHDHHADRPRLSVHPAHRARRLRRNERREVGTVISRRRLHRHQRGRADKLHLTRPRRAGAGGPQEP